MADNSTSGGGVGFVGALTILFVGLKLGDVIGWSWWWVLSPLWIYAGISVIVVVVCIAIVGLDRLAR